MSQSKLFNCVICGQEASTESDIRTHMLLEHEENEGSCPLCDLRHLTLEELNLHVNTAHSMLSPKGEGIERKMFNLPNSPSVKGSSDEKGWSNLEEEDFQCITNGVETSPAVIDQNLKINKQMIHSQVNKLVQKSPRSCACNFENGRSLEQSMIGLECFDAKEQLPHSLNSCYESSSQHDQLEIKHNLDNSCIHIKSRSLCNVKNTSSVLDRKRTRSTARLSFGSASSGVGDANLSNKEYSERSSSSSTSSPFKKILKMLSPNKSKSGKSRADDDMEDVERMSSRSELDGIWSEGQDDSITCMSDPECPFCGFSDLDPQAMAQHVEHEHSDALTSPDSSNVSTMNRCNWNTSMIQKSMSPSSPKPTLLSLSKQAHNLHTVVTCPICGLGNYDPDFITLHINTEHPTSSKTDSQTNPNKLGNTTSVPLHNGAGPSTVSEHSVCPVCGLSGLDMSAMNKHVDSHFEVGETFQNDRQLARQLAEEEKQLHERRERETFKKLQAQYGMDKSGSYKQQSEQELERAVVRGKLTVADYNKEKTNLRRSLADGVDGGKSRTSGLIQKMITYYTDQSQQGLSYVRLCSETDHFSSTYGDKGWGCGYRNLQILLSSLVHMAEYRQVLFNGNNAIPSIHKLQQLIEAAWAKGFDPQGRDQLGGHLVNSSKWIGATEIIAMLSSLHVKCRLIDFHTPSGPGTTHPALFEWVRDYFRVSGLSKLTALGKNGIKVGSIQTGHVPLYLQHQGHSRSIIGCEVHKDNSIRLLLFDPSYKVNEMHGLGSAKLDGYAMRPIRKSLVQMKAKQYQIVSVDKLMTTQQEYEQSKILKSERKP